MELDTGSALTIISEKVYRENFKKYKLDKVRTPLKSFSGHTLKPLGKANVPVHLNGQTAHLDMYVVPLDGPSLFGRDWLYALKLNWHEIKSVRAVSSPSTLQTVLDKHDTVFLPELGKMKGINAHLNLKENAQPKFLKARSVPFALRPKIESELDRLQEQGVISPVKHSDWATPIVPALKKNGSVRICGDYRVTVNPAINAEQYPLPKVTDIFANLSGGQRFSKIDLTQAYHQMELDDESKKLLVINTHKGLFIYNRLVFGVSSSPAIWQRAIEQVLQGIDHTQCILDDIIITGSTEAEHLSNLDTVLQRLEEYGLKANLSKCEFFKDRVAYCGHEVDKSGIHKSPEKVSAIANAPKPENVQQLRAFLGLVTYYHRFVPNLSTVVAPLNELLHDNVVWNWSESQDRAFQEVKDILTSDLVLCHYDPQLPLKLACDASPYGIGCVLSHVFPDNVERPIAYASRTLRKSEKGYAQIDKEALSLYWGVQKFNDYLYGRHFTLVTDHKPLLSILSLSKALPTMTAARLQRYAIFLSGYSYDIEFRSTHAHCNADALSRLPVTVPETEPDEISVFYSAQFDTLPVTCDQVRTHTQRDPTLSQILDFATSGSYPKNCDPKLRPYYDRKDCLTVHQGCLMFGNRVIIPESLQESVLNELHSGHPGIVRMKTHARAYVWWPNIDRDLEHAVQTCSGCASTQRAPPAAPVHPWDWPNQPWYRLHIDFAGPFKNSMFLIVVDSHSKWPEVFQMNSTTASATISILRMLFARFGIPREIVSDNGPQFISHEMKEFLKSNGIRHMTSAPFHPRTNGLAERFVQSFKQAIKSAESDSTSMNQKLSAFLLKYRTTPHATTNETPSMLMFGRNIRTRLDLIKPNTQDVVQRKQYVESKHCGNELRELEQGDLVQVRDYRDGRKWATGNVVSKTGPLSYTVDTGTKIWRRHIDQIRKSHSQLPSASLEPSIRDIPEPPSVINLPPPTVEQSSDCTDRTPEVKPPEPEVIKTPAITPQRRYPLRNRRAPVRMDL